MQQQALNLADAIAVARGSDTLVAKLQKVEAELSNLTVQRAASAGQDSVSALAVKACAVIRNHNPAGLAALIDVVEIMPKDKRFFLLSTAGAKRLQRLEIALD